MSARGAGATSTAGSRERLALEAQANAVRARLAARLDALVDRKRRLLDPSEELKRHPREALVLGGTVALLLVAGLGVVAYRVSTREARARRARWDGWARLVAHPERVSPKRPSFLLTVLEKSASAAVVATLTAVAKHLVVRHIDRASLEVSPLPLRDPPGPSSPPHRPAAGPEDDLPVWAVLR